MKPKPLASPELCPEGYELHAYCKYEFDEHEWSEFPHAFIGDDRASCRRQARNFGWLLHNDRTATCPKCARALGLANR